MKILVFISMLLAASCILHAGGAALHVVRPSGGEMFAEGDTIQIEWSGVQSQDTVILEFSTDNGRSWSLISDQATGLQFQWIIPARTADSCLMRVAQRVFPSAAITIPHTRPVTDITYTADGTKILSVTNDGVISRWNGLTGAAEYSNSANALYIASSPSGQYFAVTHKDGTGTIWDANTGLKRTTGFGTIGIQGRISFLNNDTIAMPCLNVSVFTGRYRLPGGFSSDNYGNYNHTKIVNDTRFNTLKTRLISGGDDTAVIRDFRAGINKVTAKLIHSSNVWSVDLSPDASRALTNDKAGNVYYWDALTSTKLSQLGDKSFTMSRMKPDGKYALGGGRIQTIDGKPAAHGVVWDLTSMSVVRYLRGHTAGINAVCYSPDGKRMATASTDATVKIWDLSESQSAMSPLWKISQPFLTTGLINVKQCFVGASKDTSFPTALRNLSNATVRIQSIRLTGGDSANFSITNSSSLGSILSGNSEALTLQFTPTAIRTFSTTVEIITKNQVVRFTVLGEGVERVLGFAPVIELGPTYLGDRRDTTIRVVLTNSAKQPIEITGTTFTGDGQISIIGGNNAFTLAPSESHTMTFSFTPTKVGTTSASLSFDYIGFGSPAVIPVSAEGICSRGPETVSAGSITDILPDQLIHIPIVLSFPTNELRSNIREYSFSVRFNKSVLLPIEPTPMGTEVGTDRVITFRGIQNGNDTLTMLHCYTAIGTSEITDIAIENFKWTACGTEATTIVGKVKIAVCTDGGTRLYNLTGQTASLKILPNDTKSGTPSIHFHTPETGNVEIAILNFLGESTKIFSGNCTTGDYSLPIEVNNLSTGVYFVRMTTPTAVLTEKIVVQ